MQISLAPIRLLHLSPDDLPHIALHPATRTLAYRLDIQDDVGENEWRSLTRKEIARLEIALDFLQTPTYAEQSPLAQLEGYWDALPYLSEISFWPQIYQDVLLMCPDPSRSVIFHEVLEDLNNFGEQIQFYQELLDHLGEQAHCVSIHGIGRAYYYQGRFEAAYQYFCQLLAQARQRQDKRAETWAIEGLALVSAATEDKAQLIHYGHQYLERAQAKGDLRKMVRAVCLLAMGYRITDMRYLRFQKSLDLCNSALAIVEKTGDRESQIMLLAELSFTYTQIRQLAHGLHYAEACLALAEKTRTNLAIQQACALAGCTYIFNKDFARAEEIFLAVLKSARFSGNLLMEEYVLGYLLVCCIRSGQFYRAIEYGQQAITLAQRLQKSYSLIIYQCNLAFTYSNVRQYKRAKLQALRAIVLARRLQEPLAEIIGWGILGMVELQTGQWLRGCRLLIRVMPTIIRCWHWEGAYTSFQTILAFFIQIPSLLWRVKKTGEKQ